MSGVNRRTCTRHTLVDLLLPVLYRCEVPSFFSNKTERMGIGSSSRQLINFPPQLASSSSTDCITSPPPEMALTKQLTLYSLTNYDQFALKMVTRPGVERVFLHGGLHRVCHDKTLVFDLGVERFRAIPLPKEDASGGYVCNPGTIVDIAEASGTVVSADTLIAAADGDPHGGHKTKEKKGSGKTSSTKWSL
ncbi:hypothetical protein ACFX2I_020410 [Malus domestica]